MSAAAAVPCETTWFGNMASSIISMIHASYSGPKLWKDEKLPLKFSYGFLLRSNASIVPSRYTYRAAPYRFEASLRADNPCADFKAGCALAILVFLRTSSAETQEGVFSPARLRDGPGQIEKYSQLVLFRRRKDLVPL